MSKQNPKLETVRIASSKSDGSLHLIQFSDLHLHDHPNDTLLGVDTNLSFSAVVQLARRNHWPPDMVLVTGDNVHSGSIGGYKKLYRLLQPLQRPTFCLPGNHDLPDNMHKVMNGAQISTKRVIEAGNWKVLMLDSTVPGEEGGALDDAELQLLADALNRWPDSPFLIALHHPPNAVGSAWLDSMALANPEDLYAILDRHPRVRYVINGHVHQEHEFKHKNVTIYSSPSTCVQFKPYCDEFSVDTRTPGYRWLELRANGDMLTGINRLDQLPADIDIAASGY